MRWRTCPIYEISMMTDLRERILDAIQRRA